MPGQGSASSLQQVSLAASLPPAQVPASIRGKIQCSEYINLSELLAYDFQYRYSSLDDSQVLEIVDSKLSLAPKYKARHLSTLQMWLWAWHLYEDTLLSFYPHRYLELSHYWHHITDLDQCFHWAAMLSYDVQFHHKCAIQGLPFSAFDQQLYFMTFNATAAKVSACRCYQCQCFDQEVIDCPFPLGAPLEKDPAMKKAGQGQQGLGNSTDNSSSTPLPGVQVPNCLLSTTRAGRCALSSNQVPAASPAVEGLMCAGTVSRTTQLQNVILQVQSHPSI